VGNRCANHVTPLYPQKLALTSPTGGGRSVGMVRSRTKATELRPSSGALDVELQHMVSAPRFWMGGGLENHCIGRVYGADGAVRVKAAGA